MQKSGKTSKIDFYKFLSPRGQVSKDDSEGTVSANIISVKVVKGSNQLGATLNSMGVILQKIADDLKVNAAMEADLFKGINENSGNLQGVSKDDEKKGSGLTEFIAPVVAGFFESLAKLGGWLFKTFVVRGILEWLADENNIKKLEDIVDGVITVATFIFNFFKGTVGGILDGLGAMFDPEATWWEKLVGFGQFFLSLGTLLLGLRWLKNPAKLVKDFIWVLTTFRKNLLKGMKGMKMRLRGRGGLALLATTAVVGTTAVVLANNNGNDQESAIADSQQTEGNGANTTPEGKQSNKQHVILTAGSKDFADPQKGAEGVAAAIAAIKELGYQAVFVPPSNQDDRYKPVHDATVASAQAAGAMIEYGSYDKDNKEPYSKILPKSIQAIQSKFNGAYVIGDQAEEAGKPKFIKNMSAKAIASSVSGSIPKKEKQADKKNKLPKKAMGGWIQGPQSGYPVSLDGKSTSFIGHGTEYVAEKKQGGAFIVPFDTPATKNNPKLTTRRIKEADSGGFNLGGMYNSFDQGGPTQNNFNLLNPMSWFSGQAQKATRGELDNVSNDSFAGKLYNRRKKQEEMMREMGYSAGGDTKGGSSIYTFNVGGLFAQAPLTRPPEFAAGGLLDFIASGEGGYNSMNQGTKGNRIVGSTHDSSSIVKKKLTDMSVGELIERQSFLMNKSNPQEGDYGIFAAGRYQVIPGTMKAIVNTMGIDKSAKFDKTMQDKIGIGLIKHKQPYAWRYISKEHNDRTGAMKALAGEWASLPDPATGRSMYGGGNASSHTVEQVASALDAARGGAPLVSDNPDIMSQMNADVASGKLSGVGNPNNDTGGDTGVAQIAQTPEAKKNIAFQALQDAIMETRKVINPDGLLETTTATADAKVKAEDQEEVKTGEKMVAMTKVAAAVSTQASKSSASASGGGGGGATVVVPTNNKPELLEFLPTFGLFGASV
ncbi:hypothetical protein Syn7803C108_10 [Synechococcus phage ACG-2014d]|uniref:Uncharacterized protein n=1 Tax=Synechococcus phage ACG-2014d TaxID=1493509 RepID=A0A0E3I097_9CAUD|nr:hypothetical protein Syn7803US80_10 [Synechococcus phage ACG-2014d]AIX40372.1 hypothetical protein Syn7803C108_10 [Synechococcus phage ACG-2014d]